MRSSTRIVSGFAGLLCLLMSLMNQARGDEIQWRGDFHSAMREAAEKNRPVFIDVMMGSSFCKYCAKLERETLSDPAIAKMLNDKFIPVRHEGDKNEIKVKGSPIVQFPTLLIAAPDGTPLEVKEGFADASELRQLLEKTLVRLVPKAPPCRITLHVGPAGTSNDIWSGPRWLSIRSAEFTAQPLSAAEEREERARDMFVQAVDAYRRQQWHLCLQQCRNLMLTYPDLPESTEARVMAGAINAEQLESLGRNLSDNLGQVYWELAEAKLRQGQPDLAIPYLQRIVQSCPGTRLAASAQELLRRLGDPSPVSKVLK